MEIKVKYLPLKEQVCYASNVFICNVSIYSIDMCKEGCHAKLFAELKPSAMVPFGRNQTFKVDKEFLLDIFLFAFYTDILAQAKLPCKAVTLYV